MSADNNHESDGSAPGISDSTPGVFPNSADTRVEDSGVAQNPAATRVEDPDSFTASQPTRVENQALSGPQSASFISINLPPQLGSRYELVTELGRGAEATVWSAQDRHSGEVVAIKLFNQPPTYSVELNSEKYLQHFQPSQTVTILERGVEHGQHFEIMEYCELGTLESFLHSEQWNPDFIVPTVAELTQALGTMHPIVHGDLKPSNILLRTLEPFDLVLTDFGLTVDLGQRSRITNVGKGTLAYLAPGASEATRASGDWWALGITILELSLGHNVFQYPDGRWMADSTIAEHLATRPVPLEGVTDPRMLLLLQGLLQRDPTKRWGFTQVTQWLVGGTPAVEIDNYYSPDSASASGLDRAQIPYVFNKKEYFDPAELGQFLQQYPQAHLIARGVDLVELEDWVRTLKCGSNVKRVTEHVKELGPHLSAALIAVALQPEAKPLYQGWDLSDVKDITKLTSEATKAFVNELYTKHPLRHFARIADLPQLRALDDSWHEYVSQTMELIPLPWRKSADEPVKRMGLRVALNEAHAGQELFSIYNSEDNLDQLQFVKQFRKMPPAQADQPVQTMARLAAIPAARREYEKLQSEQAAQDLRSKTAAQEQEQQRITAISRELDRTTGNGEFSRLGFSNGASFRGLAGGFGIFFLLTICAAEFGRIMMPMILGGAFLGSETILLDYSTGLEWACGASQEGNGVSCFLDSSVSWAESAAFYLSDILKVLLGCALIMIVGTCLPSPRWPHNRQIPITRISLLAALLIYLNAAAIFTFSWDLFSINFWFAPHIPMFVAWFFFVESIVYYLMNLQRIEQLKQDQAYLLQQQANNADPRQY